MPIVENKDHTDAAYICDYCGQKIEDADGYFCPVCAKVVCVMCSIDHPLTSVEVRPNGPDYKKHQLMCDSCLAAWNKLHPKQVGLDAFLGVA